jgi:hypothetical protein
VSVGLLLLQGNNAIDTFQRPRRIVGYIVFYEVRVVSKEIRQLALHIIFVIIIIASWREKAGL